MNSVNHKIRMLSFRSQGERLDPFWDYMKQDIEYLIDEFLISRVCDRIERPARRTMITVRNRIFSSL